KQLLKLASDKTLLEQTMERVQPVVDSIAISTGRHLEDPIRQVAPDVQLIVEPDRRDTAAAIGLCATQFDDEDVLVFLPSDAYIHPAERFHEAIRRGVELAQQGITVIGIDPTHASTAYGYIETGEDDRVVAFREKPDEQTAKRYLHEGYLWNAGIFMVKVSILMDLFARHAPQIHEKLLRIRQQDDWEDIFMEMPKISFDYAVMEKAEDVYYVPAEFYWNDIGSFDALSDILQGENAVLDGDVIQMDSSGNVIHTNKTVALIDCKDLVVIDTEDALLVCPKSSVQKVKQLVEEKITENQK
ncbi:MAG: mannose-1-phosphate guanylyltransferase, partial [Nanoarchaeota archaeon]